MALISEDKKAEVWAQAMRDFSTLGIETPITKSQLFALIGLIDEGLEDAESAIVSALPAGAGKTWLIAHQEIGRELMARVEKARREEL